jgi:hypothetical protein
MRRKIPIIYEIHQAYGDNPYWKAFDFDIEYMQLFP